MFIVASAKTRKAPTVSIVINFMKKTVPLQIWVRFVIDSENQVVTSSSASFIVVVVVVVAVVVVVVVFECSNPHVSD